MTAYCPHQLQNPSLGPSVLWARFVLFDTEEISQVSIDTKGIQGKNILVILEYHHGATLRSIAGGDPDGEKDPEVLGIADDCRDDLPWNEGVEPTAVRVKTIPLYSVPLSGSLSTASSVEDARHSDASAAPQIHLASTPHGGSNASASP